MQLNNTELAMAKYRKPIRTYCNLYHSWVKMEVADLESEMYEVLFKCVNSYDPNKGASFKTLLWGSIYKRFRTIMRYNDAQKRSIVEIPFDHTVDNEGDGGDSFHVFSRWAVEKDQTPGPDSVYEAEQNVYEKARSRGKVLTNA